MEEYLDIVDENGNLTGEKELRRVVHAKGLWHWVVHIYFFRTKGDFIEILVHLRSKFKDLDPNKWDTRFGGHVDSKKSIEEAIIKEIKEETGLSINLKDLLKGKAEKYDGEKNKEFISVYYYNFLGNKEELSFDDGEVQEVKWMNENEIIDSMKNNPKIWTMGNDDLMKIIRELKSLL
ncbi:MAG TPA: NUDIX domain-containing protein [Candidatus Moranbacteria bacterium]|nr:NUDIX domain-containing protein [Candidatus Pacearchaeota archaeon]HRY27785.1 NUDIX domain-containing protein [Candidatus Moranbacteria bacterium]HSA08136.1 NUDIX domain-containing protein [Candidatus Moranbacteria bacterium]